MAWQLASSASSSPTSRGGGSRHLGDAVDSHVGCHGDKRGDAGWRPSAMRRFPGRPPRSGTRAPVAVSAGGAALARAHRGAGRTVGVSRTLPELVADQLHEWVWTAARPAWESAAIRTLSRPPPGWLTPRCRRKVGRYDRADLALCRDAFSTDQPVPGKPRLRFSGDRTSETWRSRRVGRLPRQTGDLVTRSRHCPRRRRGVSLSWALLIRRDRRCCPPEVVYGCETARV
jgi:hypothetical protein